VIFSSLSSEIVVINDLKLLKDLQNFYFIISIKLISFKVESLTKVWLVGVLKLRV